MRERWKRMPWREGATILVTGGCGFLGRRLVDRLVGSGHQVRVLDDLSTGVADLPAGTELVRGSVLDPFAVGRAADGVDAVFHLAGVVGMRLATSQARAAFETASLGTRLVLDATGSVPAVLYSSSAVYGLGAGPMSEERSIDRGTILAYDGGREGYACGKWELEQLAAEVGEKRPTLVIRPFNVVGPGQVATYGMAVPTFVERALAGDAIVVYGDGSQRRCFADVETFTDAVLDVAAQPSAWQSENNVVNVGSQAETSIGDLARLVLRATGSSSGIVYEPYESVFPGRTDVRRRVPSTTRLHRLIGEPPWPSIEMTVKRIVHAINSPQ